MKDLLKKLVDIDREAQAIDAELRKEKDNLEVEILKNVQQTKDKYMTQAKQTVDEKTAIIREKAEKQWKESSKKYDVSRSALENQFNENFDKWADTIVADVLT